jgi:hypothetical protein
MMIILLIAGIGVLLAGLAVIAYGIVLDLSLGNSLIVAGTVAACSGLIVLSLSLVTAELKRIARRLADSRDAGEARVRSLPPPAVAQSASEGRSLFSRHQESAPNTATALATASASPPWDEETTSRPRQEAAPEAASAEPDTASLIRQRRNLLFASSMRRERERAQARDADPVSPEARSQPTASEPAEPSASFENAWSRIERARAGEVLPQRRSGRAPSTFADAGIEASDGRPPAPQAENRSGVTVLKSGVVDGMAYSLYSDGSIEAQMPEGLMRFASLDELTAHIERR